MGDEQAPGYSNPLMQAIRATDPEEGKPHWTVADSPSPEAFQGRMQDFLRTHAVAGRSYEEAKSHWDQRFQGIDAPSAETYKAWETRAPRERLLDQVSAQAEKDQPTTSGLNLVLGPLGADTAKAAMYAKSKKRFEDNKAVGDDYGVIAHYELEQRRRQEFTEEGNFGIQTGDGVLAQHINPTLAKVANVGMQLPGTLAALSAGGAPAAALMPAKLAAATGWAATGWAATAAKLGLSATSNPALIAPAWIENNKASGRDPFDVAGLPNAAATAVVQLGIYEATGGLGSVIGKRLAPWGSELAQKMIGAGVSGPVVQMAADMTTHIAGLSEHYGLVQDLVEGKLGEALAHGLNDVAMNAAMAGSHGGDPHEALGDSLTRIELLRKRGASAEKAVKTVAEEGKVEATAETAQSNGKIGEVNNTAVAQNGNGEANLARQGILTSGEGNSAVGQPVPGTGLQAQTDAIPVGHQIEGSGRANGAEGVPPSGGKVVTDQNLGQRANVAGAESGEPGGVLAGAGAEAGGDSAARLGTVPEVGVGTDEGRATVGANDVHGDIVPQKPSLISPDESTPRPMPEPDSIKNASTEQGRADLNLPPRAEVDPVGHSFPELAKQAREEAQNNPLAGDDLVAKLRANPAPMSDKQDALMLVHQVELKNAYNHAANALIEAEQSGTPADIEQARLSEQKALGRVSDAYDAVERAGSENGRGLNARKMMMMADYSLANLTLQKRAAKGGVVTDADKAQAREYSEKIAAMQEQIDKLERRNRLDRLESAHGGYIQQVKDLTAELMDKDKSMNADIHAAIKQARGLLKDVDVPAPDNPTLRQLGKMDSRGRLHLDLSNPAILDKYLEGFAKDYASIPGFDGIVESVRGNHPDLFQEWEDVDVNRGGKVAADKLYEWLKDPPAKLLTPKEAEAKARELLADVFGDEAPQTAKEVEKENAPTKATRTVRVSAARAEVDAAWKELTSLGKGDRLFSVGAEGGELIVKLAKLAKAYIKLGVANVADFMAKVEERQGRPLGDDQKGILAQAWDQAGVLVAGAKKQAFLDRLKDKVDDPAAVSRVAKKLHREAVINGADRDTSVGVVHKQLEPVVPGITEAATADAIAGYGIYKPLSKEALEVELRDQRGQLRQLGKLRDLDAGIPPKLSGNEQPEPSAEERRLIQKVNDKRKELGLQVTDPETQLKTAMDSAKTRLRNQLDDLNDAIDKGTPIERSKKGITPDAELTTLRAKRDAVKAQYDELFGDKGRAMTDEQRLKAAIGAADSAAAEYTRQIEAQDFARKKGKAVNSAELEAARANRDAIKAERDAMKKLLEPVEKRSKEDIVNARLEADYKRKIADYTDRLARGDVSQPAKPAPVPRTREVMDLQGQMRGLQNDWKKIVEDDRRARRPLSEKIAEKAVGLIREGAISSPTTMVKVAAASGLRYATTPMKELAGQFWKRVFPALAAQAPREGRGFTWEAEIKAASQGLSVGFRDALDRLTTGSSELDRTAGKKREESSWMNISSRLHGAAKAVAVRGEYERSLVHRMLHAQDNGVDITRPENLLRIQLESIRDSLRAELKQDNSLVDAYNSGVGILAKSNSAAMRSLGMALQAANPVVRVPTNDAAEIFTHALGLPVGLAQAAKAYKSGFKNLTPDQADTIMRNLKTGSLVGMAFAGYLLAKNIGGGRRFGKKVEEEDAVEPGGVRVAGVTIPKYLIHNPTLEMLQMGATIYHASHEEHKGSKRGFTAGVSQAVADWANNVPFFGGLAQKAAGATNLKPEERGYALGELVKGMTVPQIVQWLAKQLDKSTPFHPGQEPTKRKPGGIIERVETGIPGLRTKVPAS